MSLTPILICIVLIACTTAFGLTGCSKNELAEKPPRSAETTTFDTLPSTIGALVNIPMSAINSLLNANIPATFSAGGNGEDVCVRVIKDICAGTKYEFSANRGNTTVSAAGPGTLRVSMPVSFSGQGGFRGDIAAIIKADRKNFDGGLIVNADLTPRLGEDWCPKLDVAVSYSWTSNPRVEIVSRVNVDVKGQVEGKLNEKLPQLVESAKSAIDCSKFKAELVKIYGTKTFPVDVPGAGAMHINIQPSDIAFSGVSVEPSAVKVAATLIAKVDISASALAPEALPLPVLKSIALAAPKMAVNLPVRASYETLTAAINHGVVGKVFEQDTKAGKVAITVKGVEIYPSNGRIVVGLQIDAKTPATLLDTHGTVYLLGTPKVDGGTKVRFLDATYSQTLDNKFWNVVSIIFEGNIRDAIQKSAEHDFAPEIENAKDVITKKLRDPAAIPGALVALSNVEMQLGRVAVAEKELAVEALFSAAMTIDLVH